MVCFEGFCGEFANITNSTLISTVLDFVAKFHIAVIVGIYHNIIAEQKNHIESEMYYNIVLEGNILAIWHMFNLD